jgi:hypothetical protein
MKRLIEVTREETAPHSMYLRYSTEPVAELASLDGDDHYVNVGRSASGDVVGIEIVFPGDRSVDLVAAFAHENDLSLAGVFVPELAHA